jgi:hypothetical protein
MSWGYVAVAAATVAAGYISSEGAKSAAEEQADAAEAAAAESARQFDESQAALASYSEAGELALQQQQALTGLLGTEAQQEAYDAFTESPGQQYLREQQEKALLRSASAVGGLGGGNVLTALQEQAYGIAAQDYESYYNQLAGLSGTGQVSTTTTAELAAESTAATAAAEANAAAARASGILAESQAITTGISELTGLAAQSGVLGDTTTTQPTTTTTQPQSFLA